MARHILILLSATAALLLLLAATPSRQTGAVITALDRNGASISQLADGDTIKLQVKLATTTSQPTPVSFTLDPGDAPVAECIVPKGGASCQTGSFASLGWYWSRDRQAQPRRTVRAALSGTVLAAPLALAITPRPVVFVHGFGSSAEAWAHYFGSQGYLAAMGLRGFAVGDGQVPGRLNLGNLAAPSGQTESIRTNAEILGRYIADVKKATGAQMVDLVAHSMGNLVSRYYIDRTMPGRDVAQLILLGPPNQGTDCSTLPASLGLYLPAVMELRPAYIRSIFNRQITHRHGVPFTIIAGTPIRDPIQSPCTSIPSDLAIALDSASGIQAPIHQIDVWHTDLNSSERVFADWIKPLLQRPAGEFPNDPDPAPATAPQDELQFTRVITGHVNPGSSATQTIQIDNVAVASFALFDTTRSLTVTVRGASGNVIALDPVRNGMVVVQDPATLVYLGYGFANPRPGPWQVTLQATAATPSRGADYAITAHLQGGAVLKAQASTLFPRPNEPVLLTGQVTLGGQALALRNAQGRVRFPNGESGPLALTVNGSEIKGTWQSAAPGLHGIDLVVNGNAPDGTAIERSAFLALEVQPAPEPFQTLPLVTGLGLAGCVGLVGLIAIVGLLAVGRRRRSQGN